MKNQWLLVVGLLNCLIGFLSADAQDFQRDSYVVFKSGFKNPPVSARPKVYWWCLNGNIDTVRAKQEFLAMKNAGIGGLDLFEIGALKQDSAIPAGPAFLSDESLKILRFVVNEAGKLGLTAGLNLASSWNAGGSWVPPRHGGKSLYYSKTVISGGDPARRDAGNAIPIPFPEVKFPRASLIGGTGKMLAPFGANGKPVYFEEVAVLAIPAGTEKKLLDTSQVIDVSRFLDPERDVLNWKAPPGDWEIHRYICSNSGQELVLPSPHSAGLTIDHFDSAAVRMHLMHVIDRLQSVLGDFSHTALKSFYLASYEARGFVWTSTLPLAFRSIHGYDIYKFLPSFFDPALFTEETTQRVQSDFRKTLSELMINNLYTTARKICNSYGLQINCEAGGPGYPLYNGPAEPLKALGALDIPRGEFWVNHANYYKDEDSRDSIDILRVVKEVAAASHIYKRRIVEEEAFTSFQHWQEGPADLKPIGDRAFCEGMNRVVFHGFSHNPSGTGFPGIVYHAGTHFNDKRVWWPKAGPFVEYLSRISYIAQEADFVADVLYYYGDKIPNSVAPKNTQFTVGPGYDYEVVNTDVLLNDLTVKNGELVLSNGASFSILALRNEPSINPLVLKKLWQLAAAGAVIVGAKPQKVTAMVGQPPSLTELKEQLWKDAGDLSGFSVDKTGRVYAGTTPLEMLQFLEAPPDFYCRDEPRFPIDYIHYRKEDMDFYFLRNTSDQWISRECGFRQVSRAPEIWDPLTGSVIPVTIFNRDKHHITIPVTLAPFGSYIVAFRKGALLPHYTRVSSTGQYPPLIQFTENGFLFLNKGALTLHGRSGSRQVENKQEFKNKPAVQVLDGPWQVSFSKNWGGPDSTMFPELISWTSSRDPGIRYYSGTGAYRKTFRYNERRISGAGRKIFLDLGDLSKIAEVWLNGHPLGVVWTKPYQYDITGLVRKGNNEIMVEVANTWSNRLTGDAITGQQYTKTNIAISSKNVRWADTPLIPSGLFGPVVIRSVALIK